MPSFLTERSRNVAAFAVLGGAQVTLVAAITLLTVPLPALQREFGLGQGDLALLTSAYGLTFGGLLLLGGRLADRWGAREVFLAGMALLALASAAGGLAPDHVVLLAARFVQGVGAAMAAPAAVSLVTRLRPDARERERALAVWGTLSVTGAVAGSLLSGLVAAVTSWRWSFLLPAAVGVAAVTAGAFLLPPAPRTAARLDVPGALLATAGLVAFAYGLLEGATAVTATGLVLAAGFVVLQARTPHPLLPLRLVAHRRRGAALLVVFVTAAASATTTFLLSLYMQQVRGLSPISTSLAFLPFLLVVVMGPLSGRLLRRFGVRPVLVAGLLLAAVSMLLLGRVASEGSVLAGLLVFPVASGLAFSGATVAALDGVRAEDAGAAGALVNTAMEAGPTVGLAVLVALAAARTGGMPAGGARAMTEGYGFALTAMAPVFLLAAATVAVAFTHTAFTHRAAGRTAAGRTAFAQTKER
ncbi:MFS transporter [Microbispora bryophytorum]|uniref:MFS transporter n=1 Tax=Microbispora bryophytorum TaxID=1460882 RepID=UPI003400A303